MQQFSQNSNFLSNRILIHCLFWLCFVSFFAILWGSYEGLYAREFYVQCVELPVKMLIVYLNLYYFIPQFLISKKYLAYFVILIPTMIVLGMIQWVLFYNLVIPYYYPESASAAFFTQIYKVIKSAVNLNTVLLFTTVVKILKYWYKDQQAAQKLAKEKLEAELKLLKGQIHPHFLFNTLNNLYSLTLKKSDCAPEVVLKLSELMNYMLYDANGQRVSLEKELNYIKNYIDLEKLRYGERVDISLNISGELGGKKIAPLLLLPMVENSFKHGVSGEIEKAWVHIDLSVRNNMLTFKVENSKNQEKTELSKRDYAKGIGLKNLKKRLELIYKENFDLKIFDEESTYLAVMKISLESVEKHKEKKEVLMQP